MKFWFWWILRGITISGWIVLQAVIACWLLLSDNPTGFGFLCLLWFCCVLAVDVSLRFYEAHSPVGYWWFCAIASAAALMCHLTRRDASWFVFLAPAIPVFQFVPILQYFFLRGRVRNCLCLALAIALSAAHIFYFSWLRRYKTRLKESDTKEAHCGSLDV